MIDLHTHTTFSDGELIPAELIRRARYAGYQVIGLSDHADHSNLELILHNLLPLSTLYSTYADIEVLVGVELTHVPPALIPETIARARALGAQYVVVHGETIVEPVQKGTNLAALEGGADILAHPGLISPEEVDLAREKGVYLELSTRKGHSLTNGHVLKLALARGAKVIINNDAHSPSDLVSKELRTRIALGAGLTLEEVNLLENNSLELVEKIRSRSHGRKV